MNFNEKVFEYVIVLKGVSEGENKRKASILNSGTLIAESEEAVKFTVIRGLEKEIATEDVIIKVRPF